MSLRHLVLSTLAIATICLCNIAEAQWQPIGEKGFSAENAKNMAFAIGANGIPYLACSQGDKISVEQYNGTTWVPVGTPLSLNDGYNLSIAISQDGTVYLAHTEIYKDISVHKFNGSVWSLVGVGGEFNGIPKLATYGNTAYLCYVDHKYQGKVSVKKLSGNNWTPVGIDHFSGQATQQTLTFDTKGKPYVAYISSLEKPEVMRFDGKDWKYVLQQNFAASKTKYISITLDSSDNIYMVFADEDHNGKLSAQKHDGKSWVTLGNKGFSKGRAEYVSMIPGDKGIPYVAFTDQFYVNKTSVMTFDSKKWVYIGREDFSDSIANHSIIARDTAGNLFVAYNDWLQHDHATVMKYTWPVSVSNVSSKAVFYIYPNPTGSILFTDAKQYGKEISIYDMAGNFVLEAQASASGIDVSKLPIGTYIIRVMDKDRVVATQQFCKR